MRTVKRSMDFSLYLMGLVLVLPLMAVIGLLIKFDSPGPVFCRQVRVGLRLPTVIIVEFQ